MPGASVVQTRDQGASPTPQASGRSGAKIAVKWVALAMAFLGIAGVSAAVTVALAARSNGGAPKGRAPTPTVQRTDSNGPTPSAVTSPLSQPATVVTGVEYAVNATTPDSAALATSLAAYWEAWNERNSEAAVQIASVDLGSSDLQRDIDSVESTWAADDESTVTIIGPLIFGEIEVHDAGVSMPVNYQARYAGQRSYVPVCQDRTYNEVWYIGFDHQRIARQEQSVVSSEPC